MADGQSESGDERGGHAAVIFKAATGWDTRSTSLAAVCIALVLLSDCAVVVMAAASSPDIENVGRAVVVSLATAALVAFILRGGLPELNRLRATCTIDAERLTLKGLLYSRSIAWDQVVACEMVDAFPRLPQALVLHRATGRPVRIDLYDYPRDELEAALALHVPFVAENGLSATPADPQVIPVPGVLWTRHPWPVWAMLALAAVVHVGGIVGVARFAPQLLSPVDRLKAYGRDAQGTIIKIEPAPHGYDARETLDKLPQYQLLVHVEPDDRERFTFAQTVSGTYREAHDVGDVVAVRYVDDAPKQATIVEVYDGKPWAIVVLVWGMIIGGGALIAVVARGVYVGKEVIRRWEPTPLGDSFILNAPIDARRLMAALPEQHEGRYMALFDVYQARGSVMQKDVLKAFDESGDQVRTVDNLAVLLAPAAAATLISRLGTGSRRLLSYVMFDAADFDDALRWFKANALGDDGTIDEARLIESGAFFCMAVRTGPMRREQLDAVFMAYLRSAVTVVCRPGDVRTVSTLDLPMSSAPRRDEAIDIVAYQRYAGTTLKIGRHGDRNAKAFVHEQGAWRVVGDTRMPRVRQSHLLNAALVCAMPFMAPFLLVLFPVIWAAFRVDPAKRQRREAVTQWRRDAAENAT